MTDNNHFTFDEQITYTQEQIQALVIGDIEKAVEKRDAEITDLCKKQINKFESKVNNFKDILLGVAPYLVTIPSLIFSWKSIWIQIIIIFIILIVYWIRSVIFKKKVSDQIDTNHIQCATSPSNFAKSIYFKCLNKTPQKKK